MKYKHILFDLDGTLLDPFLGITGSFQYALKKFGIESELEPLKKCIGPPLFDSFRNFFGLSGEDTQLAVKYYRENYSKTGMHQNVVYDGIPKLLQNLKNSGCELILATSKAIFYAEKIIEETELAQYFDVCYGSELDGRRGKKGELIAWIIENHPINLSESLMVGDRMHDIEGAHENGIPCAAVMWGYGSRAEFEENGADYIAADLGGLEAIILN